MNQKEIVLYTKRRCLHCWRIKRLLRRRDYIFEVIDVSGDDQQHIRPVDGGSTSLPRVFVDHRPVGGFATVMGLDRSGDLDRLVRGEV